MGEDRSAIRRSPSLALLPDPSLHSHPPPSMEKLSSMESVAGAGKVGGRCLGGSAQIGGSVPTGGSDQLEVASLCGRGAASRAGREVEGALGDLWASVPLPVGSFCLRVGGAPSCGRPAPLNWASMSFLSVSICCCLFILFLFLSELTGFITTEM